MIKVAWAFVLKAQKDSTTLFLYAGRVIVLLAPSALPPV